MSEQKEKTEYPVRPISLMAVDLDDTLLDGEGHLTKHSADVLRQTAESGIEIVVASGRPFSCLPGEVTGLPFLRYAICSNGANVWRLPEGDCIRKFLLKEEAVFRILQIAGEYPVYLEASMGGEAYTDAVYLQKALQDPSLKEHQRAYLRNTRKPVGNARNLLQENADRLDCLNLICEDSTRKEEITRRIREQVTGIYVTSSTGSLIEISDQRAGKERALTDLCRDISIPLAEVVSFGNADNDAGMLRISGLGIAVKNATPKCRAAADRIIGSNEEESVARQMEELLKSGQVRKREVRKNNE